MSDHKLAEALRHIRNHTSVNSHQIEIIDEALVAHEAEQQAGEAVAYALLFPGDPRLCLSTVFDTYTEAINYVVTRVSGPAEIVPLFTHPQQPLTEIRRLAIIMQARSIREAIEMTEDAQGITKDTK